MKTQIHENQALLKQLLDLTQKDKLEVALFENEFYANMANVSCTTLDNINDLVAEYLNSYQSSTERGEKVLLLFGLLQGLFVAIDALYSMGKSTSLNKLLIHLNQNQTLKEIKRVRNDVVGHPTYRFYNGEFAGFCLLDIDLITSSQIVYHVYTYKEKKLKIEDVSVNMIEVIENYYQEANKIIEQTLKFIDIKTTVVDVQILQNVFRLFIRYKQNVIDFDLLNRIKQDYCQLMSIQEKDSNRFLWRIQNIHHMFKQNKTEFIEHLACVEIRKLYFLMYELEKQVQRGLKPKQLYFTQSPSIKILKRKFKKILVSSKHIITDVTHPFFKDWIREFLHQVKQDPKLKDFTKWMSNVVETDDKILLYAIGSELKANLS